MINDQDYVELGLSCADICQALQRGMNGNGLGDLSQPVCDAMNQLTTWVEPGMHSLDNSLTVVLIAELWRRSKGWSSRTAGGNRHLDFSMRRVTRK